MADKFIKGEKLTPPQVARELLPILAMWGLTPEIAALSAWRLWQDIKNMSPEDYAKAAKGMKIKAGAPTNATPQKAN